MNFTTNERRINCADTLRIPQLAHEIVLDKLSHVENKDHKAFSEIKTQFKFGRNRHELRIFFKGLVANVAVELLFRDQFAGFRNHSCRTGKGDHVVCVIIERKNMDRFLNMLDVFEREKA